MFLLRSSGFPSLFFSKAILWFNPLACWTKQILSGNHLAMEIQIDYWNYLDNFRKISSYKFTFVGTPKLQHRWTSKFFLLYLLFYYLLLCGIKIKTKKRMKKIYYFLNISFLVNGEIFSEAAIKGNLDAMNEIAKVS